MSDYLDRQLDAILRGQSGAQLRRCPRCETRYATPDFCDACLHAANANVAEKRRILLPDTVPGDELCAAV
jgi:anti-sigma factor RsiW